MSKLRLDGPIGCLAWLGPKMLHRAGRRVLRRMKPGWSLRAGIFDKPARAGGVPENLLRHACPAYDMAEAPRVDVDVGCDAGRTLHPGESREWAQRETRCRIPESS